MFGRADPSEAIKPVTLEPRVGEGLGEPTVPPMFDATPLAQSLSAVDVSARSEPAGEAVPDITTSETTAADPDLVALKATEPETQIAGEPAASSMDSPADAAMVPDISLAEPVTPEAVAENGRASSETMVASGTVVALGLESVEALLRGWPGAPSGSEISVDPVSGLDIVFGQQGNATAALGTGWSVPEAGYIWSVGHRSELHLPASPCCDLELEVAPFVHGDRLRSQRLAVFANGNQVASVEVTDHAVIAASLPAEAMQPGVPLTLVFETPDATAPSEITASDDGRVLAFSFRRLLLKPGMGAVEPGQGFAAVPLPDSDAAVPRDELMARFESLGENCEFGLVQRHCGIEPLGLLRFASAPLPKLRAALRAEFEGMGRAENLDVQVSSNGNEYMVHDRVFDLNYHAWVRVEEQTRVEVHEREVKRVPFLVRKLLEDLRSGEKIFVFHGMEPLSLANARDLRADLGRYGPGTLLWVELADAEHPPGSVEWAGEALLKGYIDRFAPGEDAHDLSLQCWVDVCQRALSAVSAKLPGLGN